MRRKSKVFFAGIGCLILANLSQTPAHGQNANPLDSLWSRLNSIYVQSNFLNTDDATEVESMLKGAVDRAGSQYGADSEEVLQPTLELCRLYKMQARYGELRAQSKKVSQVYSKLPAASKLRFAPNLLDQARDLSSQNRNVEAKALAAPVLELLETEKSALDDQNVLNKLGELAANVKSRKEFATCEPMYRALLLAYERKQPVNELALADMRTQFAEILKEQGNISTATELAMLALEGQEKAGADCSSSKSISTLVLLTGLQLTAGKAKEAKQLLVKLDSALSHASFQERRNLLQPILDLCSQYAQLNDYQSVKTLFSRSLSIADQYSYSQYDSKMHEIATALVAGGKADVAESLYLELTQWVERPASVADTNYRSTVLTMLTKFYAETGQFNKLIPLMVKLANFDLQHKTTSLYNVQSNIESTNNAIVREKLYELLAAKPASNAYERRQTAYYHVKLAEVYLMNNRNDEAKKEWYHITTMMEDSLPQDCKDLGNEVRIIFDKYVREKRFQEGQSLANNMTSYGFDQNILVSVSNGFTALSRHQDALGNTPKAIKLVERSIAVSEKYGGKLTYNYCEALTQYAALLRKSGKIQQAEETDKKVVQLRAELQRCGINRYG